jgi:hypothetical protein
MRDAVARLCGKRERQTGRSGQDGRHMGMGK